jgi:hypothetical protein
VVANGTQIEAVQTACVPVDSVGGVCFRMHIVVAACLLASRSRPDVAPGYWPGALVSCEGERQSVSGQQPLAPHLVSLPLISSPHRWLPSSPRLSSSNTVTVTNPILSSTLALAS